MASKWKSFFRILNGNKDKSSKLIPITAIFVISGTVTILYTLYKYINNQDIQVYQSKSKERQVTKLPSSERRFKRFASLEYEGQVYMSPRDFLKSIVVAEPRRDLKKKILNASNMEYIKNNAPSLPQGSPRLFRDLKDTGIISYTDYLFLLSVLTKPQYGYRIAFNMFDTDENERIDKNEFLVIRNLLPRKRKVSVTTKNMFNQIWKQKRLSIKERSTGQSVEDERSWHVDTTLVIYLFGSEGKEELQFEQFRQFMLDLQKEVIELEFNEYSKEFPTISEVDFARAILRYSSLYESEYKEYLKRLFNRNKETKGINFEEFYTFFQFLNHLDDFSIAISIYTLANHSISKEEFQRAVEICTGTSLSQKVVDTVFTLFDKDGDGLLSYSKFITIMKERLHRNFKLDVKNKRWNAFKNCMNQI